jgi:hypothetical protein
LESENVELWQVCWQPGVFLMGTLAKVVTKPVVVQEEGDLFILNSNICLFI